MTTRRIPDTYKPKPNPYLNTNPNPILLDLRVGTLLEEEEEEEPYVHTV